ncbi:MAG: carboxypeptidase regulatory-like domain-containing protein [Gemmatimonadaceae bacterium]
MRGTVTGDSGAVVGATVHVTRGPDRRTLRTLTDSAGMFSVTFDTGTGDYLVHVSMEGFRAERRRLTGSPQARTLEIAVRLARSVAQLTAVRVQARRPRPARGDQASNQTGAADRVPDDFGPLVLPDARGTIAGLAEATPGVVNLPTGLSVLGLPSEQNRVTLGGVGFDGSAIPRSLGVSARLSTTSYDPAVGWGAGAQLAVDVFPGGLYAFRNLQLVAEPDPLQPARRDGTGFGPRSSNVVVSGAFGGPLGKRDRVFYAAGFDAHRRRTPATTFATASAADLARGSIGAADAGQLLAALSPWGLLQGRKDDAQASEGGSLLARVDLGSRDPVSGAPVKQTFGLLGHLQAERRTGIGASPAPLRSLPGTWARGTNATGMLQGIWSAYIHGDWLSETRTAVSVSSDRIRPNRELLSAIVPLRSDAAGPDGAFANVRFGGGPELAAGHSRWSWETLHETYFYAAAATRHRVKLTAGSRLEGYEARATGTAAALRYRSPADVGANSPSEFTVSAGLPRRSATAWNGFLGVGDLWRVHPTLHVLAGARLEATRFLTSLPELREVGEALQTATAATPGGVHLSPRLGFQWSFRGGGGTQLRVTPLGRLGGGRTHFVRGGIGEFRQFIGSNALDWPLQTASGSHLELTCVGDRIPTIDWPGWNSGRVPVPSACNAETGAQARPATIQLLAPALRAPASWRANLAYSSVLGPALLTIEGIYSWDRHQFATVDRNLRPHASFTVADEGRPSFAPASSIVPASGAVDPRGIRQFPAFGPILVRESSEGGHTRQLTIQVVPVMRAGSPWSTSIAYTRSAGRVRQRGVDAAVFGDPRPRNGRTIRGFPGTRFSASPG